MTASLPPMISTLMPDLLLSDTVDFSLEGERIQRSQGKQRKRLIRQSSVANAFARWEESGASTLALDLRSESAPVNLDSPRSAPRNV
jgi:hypothetical protein